MAQTKEITRRFGRHRLRPGVHQPFDDIALVYRSICVVSGALIRRDVIDWHSIPRDIPLGVDTYIAYLLATSGRSCWYDAERLAQVRYHPNQIGRTMRADPAVAEWGLAFWKACLEDRRIGHHTYHKLCCARAAIEIVLDRFRRRDWAGLREKLEVLFRMGLVDPRSRPLSPRLLSALQVGGNATEVAMKGVGSVARAHTRTVPQTHSVFPLIVAHGRFVRSAAKVFGLRTLK